MARYCTNCYNIVEEDDTVCGKCGMQLKPKPKGQEYLKADETKKDEKVSNEKNTKMASPQITPDNQKPSSKMTPEKKKIFIIAGAFLGVIVLVLVGILIFSPCTLLGHKYSEEIVTEATCQKEGLKRFTCKECQDTYEDKIPFSDNHQWSDWTTTAEATYFNEGSKTRTCQVCGTQDTQKISKSTQPPKDEVLINENGKYLAKVYSPTGLLSFSGSFSGSGNFIVKVLDVNQNLEELVCNEIGSYVIEKSVKVDPGWHYFQVDCSRGQWTMNWYGTGGN